MSILISLSFNLALRNIESIVLDSWGTGWLCVGSEMGGVPSSQAKKGHQRAEAATTTSLCELSA